jgi:hypothetical protein
VGSIPHITHPGRAMCGRLFFCFWKVTATVFRNVWPRASTNQPWSVFKRIGTATLFGNYYLRSSLYERLLPLNVSSVCRGLSSSIFNLRHRGYTTTE